MFPKSQGACFSRILFFPFALTSNLRRLTQIAAFSRESRFFFFFSTGLVITPLSTMLCDRLMLCGQEEGIYEATRDTVQAVY